MNVFHETDTGPLRREDAATYLRERHGFRICTSTLSKYAHLGVGPVYRLAGRTALYEIPHLDAWAVERISRPRRMASPDRHEPDGSVYRYA